jgi:hypothetical protein
MLIIQIALGIVLAVLILAFLPHILALGVVGVGIAIALAALAGVFWLFGGLAQEAGGTGNLIGILVGLGIVIGAIYQVIEMRPRIEAAIQVNLLDAIVPSATAAGGAYIEWIFFLRIAEPDTPIAQLILTQLFALGLFAWSFFSFRSARREYKSSLQSIRATYQDSDHPVP